MGTKRSTTRARAHGEATSPRRSSVADALFTKTQQRVLSLLFGQPSRSFRTSQVIRLTRSGSGAVQRELSRLESSGLIVATRVGRQKHYRANAESPIFAELHKLVLKTVGMIEPIRRALQPLSDDISLALVYGSVAKRADTASSDIDLLVVADELTLEQIYACLAPVEASLDRRINPTMYTSREFADRKASGSVFLTRILAGEHIMLIGTDHESCSSG